MLIPKRTKYRKQHRPVRSGMSKGGNEINFGDFAIQSLAPAYVTNRQIEAARIAMTRYIKRGGRVWITIFPDRPLTKHPLGARMGSGKGAPEFWIANVRPGRVMFEIGGVSEDIAKEALDLLVGLLVQILHGVVCSSDCHQMSPPSRAITRHFIGSLSIARRRASRATSSDTPPISNMTRPGWTLAIQNSGVPLPEPIRVPSGFLVSGRSGKIVIHTRPPRLM